MPRSDINTIVKDDFRFADDKTTGEIRYEGQVSRHQIYFLEFEGFTCVYAY